MTTLPFTATLPLNDQPVLFIECDIAGSVTDDAGTAEPYFAVDAIQIGGVALPAPGSSMWGQIAAAIVEQAKDDDDILADAMRIEGWVSRGRHGDPDSYSRRPVERVAA